MSPVAAAVHQSWRRGRLVTGKSLNTHPRGEKESGIQYGLSSGQG